MGKENETAERGGDGSHNGKHSPEKIAIDQLEQELAMFSNLIGRKVTMHIDARTRSACTNASDTIMFNPSSSCVTGNSAARAMLQHEEAHILFKSSNEVREALKRRYPDLDVPGDATEGMEEKGTIVDAVYNILEDYRVEYLWHGIFPGSMRNFGKLYAGVIANLKEETVQSGRRISDPMNALLAARFGLSGGTVELESHLAPSIKPTYKRFCLELEKLDGKDHAATYFVGRNVLDIIREWVKDREGEGGANDWVAQTLSKLKELLPMLSDELSAGQPTDKDAERLAREAMNGPEGKELEDSAARIKAQLSSLLSNPEAMGTLQELARVATVADKVDTGKKQKEPTPSAGAAGKSPENVKTTYDAGIREYSGPAICPSAEIKRQMEEIRRGNELGRMEETDLGPRLNVRKLLRYTATHDPGCLERLYLRREVPNGVEFVVMLDTSSSMGEHGKMDMEKRAIASIYDSLQGSALVKLRMYGYYGDEDGAHVFAIGRRELMTLNPNGGTPTHIALSYITRMINRERGATDSVVMLLTDGRPDNHPKTKEALAALVRGAKAKEFTIFVSPDAEYLPNEERIKDTFSASTAFYHIKGMAEVLPVLEGIIARDIAAKASKVRV